MPYGMRELGEHRPLPPRRRSITFTNAPFGNTEHTSLELVQTTGISFRPHCDGYCIRMAFQNTRWGKDIQRITMHRLEFGNDKKVGLTWQLAELGALLVVASCSHLAGRMEVMARDTATLPTRAVYSKYPLFVCRAPFQ